jgi:heavy metal efflux system protein
VTLPTGVQPQMGTDFSPVGQIYFFTLHSTNPQYDVMELKSLEDWVSRSSSSPCPMWWTWPASAAHARISGAVDPNKLISYGLSIGQVEQQLTNNNVNAGGSFIEAGLQQINVREVGW